MYLSNNREEIGIDYTYFSTQNQSIISELILKQQWKFISGIDNNMILILDHIHNINDYNLQELLLGSKYYNINLIIRDQQFSYFRKNI